MEKDTTVEQQNIREKRIAQLAPWQFKPGQSGNLKGRTPGKSLKEYGKEYLAGLTEKERVEYFEGMNKLDVWRMAEGNPKNDDTLKVDLPTSLIEIIRGTANQTGDNKVSGEDTK